MATENDDSQSMNGILSNISRDVVDTQLGYSSADLPQIAAYRFGRGRWYG